MNYKRLLIVLGIVISIGMLVVVYYHFNPTNHSFFLPCPFYQITSYQCPGCGSQRALHELLHGNIAQAFQLNSLFILSIPIILYLIGVRLWNYLFNKHYHIFLFKNKRIIKIGIAIIIAFWILRNL